MKTKTKTNQKPIEYDMHLKYRCPNESCEQIHWITLLEAKTINFKIVCYCGYVFKPKTISNIKIKYKTKPIKLTNTEQQIHQDILDKVSSILIGYGFTKSESEDLIKKSYSKNPTEDSAILVKQCLLLLGENKK